MDKDNLNIQGILTSLKNETLQTARTENLQQLMSACCLMVVGLFLTMVGLLGLMLRLVKLTTSSVLLMMRPIKFLFFPNKINSKSLWDQSTKYHL